MNSVLKVWHKLLVCVLFAVLALGLQVAPAYATAAVDTPADSSYDVSNLARPSTTGVLHVEGTNLVDATGQQVQLQGVSTHGLTWYPDFVNQELFTQFSTEWNANLIRLAAYSTEFTNGNKELSMDLVSKGIEYAIESDMYVIVDWHILEDSDPNTNIDAAIAFFHAIAKEYADCPNIIYEICNEPNGTTTWADVKEYANCIIPIIKAQNPDAVIVVGTPDYDRDLLSVVADPITGYTNIMYTFHFYAATHGDEYMETLESALTAGLPVFVTECGMSEHTGDGDVDFQQSAKWFAYLRAHHIPFAIWSLSNKEETSAMVKYSVHHTGALADSELTSYGTAVKALLQGQDISGMSYRAVGFVLDQFLDDCRHHLGLVWAALLVIMTAGVFATLALKRRRHSRQPKRAYDDYLEPPRPSDSKKARNLRLGKLFLFASTVFSLIYLVWRMVFSIPIGYGPVAIGFNILLLIVEIIGFAESSIHYDSLIRMREYPLPEAADSEFPDVDIFIATYNEPEELLRKTIIGCTHIKYPDPAKVHIYVCDDKRRASMRALAEELGVNYFDRPDNQGAKAGNLNAAMARTTSPYIVTFDADMIPREDFLLRTIPYYIDAERRGIPLGLIQTPQCFYTEDIFQHNLYSEANTPNEQDFFYRTIEPAKTSTNSVIYGGSNTILSRQALQSIGGFYTESITEDFATGMLLESAGYLGLGLSEPLASGQAPTSFKEHIQQRTRWGRGVIVTAKKLRFMHNKNLTFAQKMSYLSSVVYWFSPLFNTVYLIMPLLFSVFGLPVFRCSVLELAIFWLPMFLAQNACLVCISNGTMSTKWSGIQETCMAPFLIVPIIKEALGFSLSVFKVTDKRQHVTGSTRSVKLMVPFIVLAVLYVWGIVRVLYLGFTVYNLGLFILFFWLVRNLFFILMSLFLADGRDSDGETVKVRLALQATAVSAAGERLEGTTVQLTEHNVTLSFESDEQLRLGQPLDVSVAFEHGSMDLRGTIVEVRQSNDAQVPRQYTVEILDFGGRQDDYVYALYDRVPTLPQSFVNDLGIFGILGRNIAKHL